MAVQSPVSRSDGPSQSNWRCALRLITFLGNYFDNVMFARRGLTNPRCERQTYVKGQDLAIPGEQAVKHDIVKLPTLAKVTYNSVNGADFD
jgi:hypothetical protein